MDPDSLRTAELARVIQAAIGPVVLISGVGLLLLSMTNRYGRIVDRARSLVRELHDAHEYRRGQIAVQLRILNHRARLTRLAVTLCATCILLVAVLIAVLFMSPVLELNLTRTAIGIFVLCMLALIGSMVAFLRELYLSLHALELEIADA